MQDYAAFVGAPVRLGTGINRLRGVERSFEARDRGRDVRRAQRRARDRALPASEDPARGRPLARSYPAAALARLRRPGQLAAGAVLVVGTGQSGAQIAEELHARAGRCTSPCRCARSAPRRYRGRDAIWWLLQSFLHGAEVGVQFPTVADLPSPAARFACNPHVSGKDGGHDISLRQFARAGMHCTDG